MLGVAPASIVCRWARNPSTIGSYSGCIDLTTRRASATRCGPSVPRGSTTSRSISSSRSPRSSSATGRATWTSPAPCSLRISPSTGLPSRSGPRSPAGSHAVPRPPPTTSDTRTNTWVLTRGSRLPAIISTRCPTRVATGSALVIIPPTGLVAPISGSAPRRIPSTAGCVAGIWRRGRPIGARWPPGCRLSTPRRSCPRSNGNSRACTSRCAPMQGCHLPLSAATIRNTMSDLEEKGYLYHPHTSAGRIPTDLAYRVYVNSLMRLSQVSASDSHQIREVLTERNAVDQILERAAQVLGVLTKELGVAVGPTLDEAVLERLELLQAGSDRLLLVLTLKSGVVRTIFVAVPSLLAPEFVVQVASVLIDRLA